MLKLSITILLLSTIVMTLCFSVPSIIYPFVIAFVMAYLLDPVAWTLEKYHIPRSVSAFIVTLLILFIMTAIVIYFSPMLYVQIAILIKQIPSYKLYINENVIPIVVEKFSHLDPTISMKLKDMVDQSVNGIFGVFLSGARNIWAYTITTFHVLFMTLLIPVLLFFFLRDWRDMTAGFYDLFPKYHQNFVKKLFLDIDMVLGSYLRGLMIVCAILAIYYSIAFSVAGIELAMLLGIFSSIAIILPFIGPVLAIFISLLVGHFMYGFEVHMIYILGIYGIGILMENTLLTPNIIGDSIGLSPVWIIFAVLIFGYVSGPIGMLLAVPTTGVIAVILKHIKSDYKKSTLYNSKAS